MTHTLVSFFPRIAGNFSLMSQKQCGTCFAILVVLVPYLDKRYLCRRTFKFLMIGICEMPTADRLKVPGGRIDTWPADSLFVA
jgi:hypothetical protein